MKHPQGFHVLYAVWKLSVRNLPQIFILILHSLCDLHPHRHRKNRKSGSGNGLSRRRGQSVAEDDAIPWFVGRGHSSTTLHYAEGEGQMRTVQAWTLEKMQTEMRRSCGGLRQWILLCKLIRTATCLLERTSILLVGCKQIQSTSGSLLTSAHTCLPVRGSALA